MEEDSRDFEETNSVETSQDALVNRAIAEYLRAVDAGKPLDAKAWLAQYRPVRAELLEFLDDHHETGNEMVGGKFEALIDEARPTDMEATADIGSLIASGKTDTPSVRGGRLAASPQPKPPTIAGIRLGRLLGAGGMGHVYEGVDPSGQSVAVKLLSPSWSRSQETIDRFRQEGAIASTINHPRCVFVRAADTDNGCPYIVMELMSGETLKDLVLKRGPLPYQEALRLLLDLAEGLNEAHSHGLIHRDVKPANCYLEGSARVKVGDFGLARSIVSPSDLTSSGGFLGTPLYASPEQIRGEVLDGRTDIYSLCATLYYLLTGQAPFAADNPTKTIARIVSEDPKSVREHSPDIPIAVERLVAKGLSRDRETRFQTMSELIAAIEPLIHTQMLAVSYGKRIAATAIDIGLYSSITWIVMISAFPEALITIEKSAWIVYGPLPFIFAYYLLFDKLKGATPGKQLFKIKVVDTKNLELVSWPSVIVRTATFVLLIGYGSEAALRILGYSGASLTSFVLSSIGYVGGYLLMFTTIGRRADRPLLQDWISGTRVIGQMDAGSAPFAAVAQPKRIEAQSPDETVPAAFGRFKTLGCIGNGTFLAEDVSLGRQVWVVFRDGDDSSDCTSDTVHLDRTTRLRHVQSGTIANKKWDAYLAIDGAPLAKWVGPDHPLPWHETRSILKEFCNEMIQCQREGSTLPIESMGQIWVNARGRLVILDRWLSLNDGLEKHKADDEANAEPGRLLSPLEVANQIATIALSGRCDQQISHTGNGQNVPAKNRKSLVQRPLPMHARKIIDRLAGVALPAFESIEMLRDELLSCESFATKLQSKQRMVQVFITMLLMSPVFGATLSLIRMGNQIGAQVAFDAISGAEVLRRIAADDELYERFVASWPDDEGVLPLRDEIPKLADRIDQQCADIFQARLKGGGAIQEMMMVRNGIDQAIIDKRDQFEVSVTEDADGRIKMYQWSLPKSEANASTATPHWLARLSVSAEAGDSASVRRTHVIYLLGLTTLFASIIWKTIFRGGWSAWFSGIRYVDRDGNKAGFIRHFVRSVVLHSPLVAIGFAIISFDLWLPQYLWVSNILCGFAIILSIVIAILVMLRPAGGLHDRIAGTYPVPR